jgi:hypothetical protein
MQSVRFGQPALFDSGQSFYVSIGGSVEKSATDLIVSIRSRSDVVPSQMIAYRGPSPSTASTAMDLEGRYLPVVPNSPLVTILDAQGRRTMNAAAPGQFDIKSPRLSWFQSARLSIGVDYQPARVSVSNFRFASLLQLDNRRAEAGSITISPTERTGYAIQVDVIDILSMRIRVLDSNGVAVSDRTVLWDDVIWNYWTATQ